MINSKNNRNLRIFLCHSFEDKEIVRQLYQKLRSQGFAPWLDEEDLLPGQDWQIEIKRAVCMSDVVIVCLSKSSITKTGYMQKEIIYALDIAEQQTEGAIFLIPLKLDSCSVPSRLSQWHWVDFYEESGFGKLIRALNFRAESLGIQIAGKFGEFQLEKNQLESKNFSGLKTRKTLFGNLDITLLGMSASGKSTYIICLYSVMNKNLNSFQLMATELDQHLHLSESGKLLEGEGHDRWPPCTINTTLYEFHCKYRSKLLSSIRLLDYRGSNS